MNIWSLFRRVWRFAGTFRVLTQAVPSPVLWAIAIVATLGASAYAYWVLRLPWFQCMIIPAAACGMWVLWILVQKATARHASTRTRKFEQAIAAEAAEKEFRESWAKEVQRFRDTGKAIDSVPFLVFVGEPGGGKTTTLVKGLGSVAGRRQAIRGIGGTRNCDWFFADDGIVLDMAGRLVFPGGTEAKSGAAAAKQNLEAAEEISNQEWSLFLELLGSYRPRCPINGAIVAIPCTSLLTEDDGRWTAKADVLLGALRDLQTELEIRFPVYVVFTKADLIPGFNEFCLGSKDIDTKQLLGWSRSLDRCEERLSEEELGAATDDFVARLRAWRLGFLQDADLEAKSSLWLFGFPEEMKKVMEGVNCYLHKIFGGGDRLLETLFFKGFYFTSAMQDDDPLPGAARALLSSAPRPDWLKRLAHHDSRPAFLEDLYKKKIFVETGLVKPTRRRTQQAAVLTRIGYSLCALVLIGLSGWIIWRFVRNDARELRDEFVGLHEAYAGTDSAKVGGILSTLSGNEKQPGLMRKLASGDLLPGESSSPTLIQWCARAYRAAYLDHVLKEQLNTRIGELESTTTDAIAPHQSSGPDKDTEDGKYRQFMTLVRGLRDPGKWAPSESERSVFDFQYALIFREIGSEDGLWGLDRYDMYRSRAWSSVENHVSSNLEATWRAYFESASSTTWRYRPPQATGEGMVVDAVDAVHFWARVNRLEDDAANSRSFLERPLDLSDDVSEPDGRAKIESWVKEYDRYVASAEALRKLFPRSGSLVVLKEGIAWPSFASRVRTDHSTFSAEIPSNFAREVRPLLAREAVPDSDAKWKLSLKDLQQFNGEHAVCERILGSTYQGRVDLVNGALKRSPGQIENLSDLQRFELRLWAAANAQLEFEKGLKGADKVKDHSLSEFYAELRQRRGETSENAERWPIPRRFTRNELVQFQNNEKKLQDGLRNLGLNDAAVKVADALGKHEESLKAYWNDHEGEYQGPWNREAEEILELAATPVVDQAAEDRIIECSKRLSALLRLDPHNKVTEAQGFVSDYLELYRGKVRTEIYQALIGLPDVLRKLSEAWSLEAPPSTEKLPHHDLNDFRKAVATALCPEPGANIPILDSVLTREPFWISLRRLQDQRKQEKSRLEQEAKRQSLFQEWSNLLGAARGNFPVDPMATLDMTADRASEFLTNFEAWDEKNGKELGRMIHREPGVDRQNLVNYWKWLKKHIDAPTLVKIRTTGYSIDATTDRLNAYYRWRWAGGEDSGKHVHWHESDWEISLKFGVSPNLRLEEAPPVDMPLEGNEIRDALRVAAPKILTSDFELLRMMMAASNPSNPVKEFELEQAGGSRSTLTVTFEIVGGAESLNFDPRWKSLKLSAH